MRSISRRALFYLTVAIVGSFSFWVPDFLIHLFAGQAFGRSHILLITFLLPATSLSAYFVIETFAATHGFRWIVPPMVFGVWFSGMSFMMLLSITTGAGHPGRSDLIATLKWSMIPLSTFVFATYDGSLGALILVTIGSILVWEIRQQ